MILSCPALKLTLTHKNAFKNFDFELFLFFVLSLYFLQVSEIFDKEILEETQRERLASGNCFQQGSQCVWIAILQHCWEWGWGWRLKIWTCIYFVGFFVLIMVESSLVNCLCSWLLLYFVELEILKFWLCSTINLRSLVAIFGLLYCLHLYFNFLWFSFSLLVNERIFALHPLMSAEAL